MCLKSFGRIKNETQIEQFDPLLDNRSDLSDADDKEGILANEDDTNKFNKENVEIASRVCNSLLNKKFKTNRLRNIAATKLDDTNKSTCFVCNRSFKDKEVLVRHLNELHNGENKTGVISVNKCEINKTRVRRKRKSEGEVYNCTICSTVFSTKYLLSRHVRNVHATEKKHNCDICGQKFASPVYLSAHKKYHSGRFIHFFI